MVDLISEREKEREKERESWLETQPFDVAYQHGRMFALELGNQLDGFLFPLVEEQSIPFKGLWGGGGGVGG